MGCGGVIVNSVSALTMEKWAGCHRQYFVRVVKRGLVQVEVHFLANPQPTDDVVKDWWFGHDCEFTGSEWSLFWGDSSVI